MAMNATSHRAVCPLPLAGEGRRRRLVICDSLPLAGRPKPRSGFGWGALRAVVYFLIMSVAATVSARAGERIADFDVAIEVQKDGDILVTEKISVISEGYQIRRGIFRDLPRTYLKGARTLPYEYAVKSVERDGRKEPYEIEKDGNAYRIRIGDADVFLENGSHAYEIAYEVKNQVRYFDGYDEVYWNATGNYWAFPIDQASVRIVLSGGAGAVQTAGYTGFLGDADSSYSYEFRNGAHIFRSTRRFAPGEGMTVAVGFAKGLVDPPSAADARAEWWAANLSLVILGGALSLVGAFYAYMWNRVGRDPAKGPVFPQYEPPAGMSPAAVHRVYYRALAGHNALIATLLNLAVRKRLRIDSSSKKKTVLSKLEGGETEGVALEDLTLERDLFSGDKEVSFGGKYDAAFTSAYTRFQQALSREYGSNYFRWNLAYMIPAAIISIIAFFIAVNFAIQWTGMHTAAVIALIAASIAAARFLPAPTPKGQETRTAIEGFRLYMDTAEKLQLNAVKVGSDAPPPMTVERYERFLPYAIALGVEKPWTRHFEKLMPKEAADYHPFWASGNYGGSRSLSGLNSALVSSMASGVSSSLPQSSSSSGSGGGGSSGGGGGGGGGGGW